MPNLIEIQQDIPMVSGGRAPGDVSRYLADQDFTGNLVLEFIDFLPVNPSGMSIVGEDANYAFLRVRVRLINKVPGSQEQEGLYG